MALFDVSLQRSNVSGSEGIAVSTGSIIKADTHFKLNYEKPSQSGARNVRG
jgi:hypothetical protein